jgi:hypothetical protein
MNTRSYRAGEGALRFVVAKVAPMRALILATALSTFIAAPALACGPANGGRFQMPPIAAGIDELLPKAELPEAEIEKVKALQAQIAKLMAVGKEQLAREAEEQAMRILGYRKVYLRCGPGTFLWWRSKI